MTSSTDGIRRGLLGASARSAGAQFSRAFSNTFTFEGDGVGEGRSVCDTLAIRLRFFCESLDCASAILFSRQRPSFPAFPALVFVSLLAMALSGSRPLLL